MSKLSFLKELVTNPATRLYFLASHGFYHSMSDEEFEKAYPFTKEAMVEMTKSNPFRSNRGRDGKTMEDILKQVEDYNKALDK